MVFIDTGARSPRSFFDDPDDFDAFGKEFFFPTWVTQSDQQLRTSISQWKRACREIVSRLVGSLNARLSPACSRTP